MGLGVGWLLINGLPARSAQVALLPTVAGDPAGLATAPRPGSAAPDFELSTTEGAQLSLASLRGRPVLINFWATWCGPCSIEMPAIQAQYEKHAPALAVLAINFDESPDAVDAFVEEFKLSFDVLLDPGGQINEQTYQVRGYPSSYFIDENGIVQAVHIGIMTEGQLEGYLEQLGLQP